MHRRWALCLLLLSGCEALWGHTATPDPFNCVQTPEVCTTEQRCNRETESCEAIPPPAPDLATPPVCTQTTGEVTGTVFIPSGVLPLYGASVYVPSGPVEALPSGPTCSRCTEFEALLSTAVARTKTDVLGRFRLSGVPQGTDVPLVIRHGKWRRRLVIPQVTACTETQLDPALTRLPRNKAEGELPQIAVTTGNADAMECWLRKIGIDDSEFTPESGNGRVNLFAGHGGATSYKAPLNGGAAFTVAMDNPGTTTGWWSKSDAFSRYDLVLLGCEGGAYFSEKSSTARQALFNYVNSGGRVLIPHWQYSWIQSAPSPLSTVATFWPLGMEQSFPTLTVQVDTSTDTGSGLADWMYALDRFTTRGTLQIPEARNTVRSINPALTQSYIHYRDTARALTLSQYFMFNMPVGAATGQECGRIASTDLHVTPNLGSNPDPNFDYSNPTSPFPTGCVSKTFTPSERALTFMLIELTGCVAPLP
jgi:hypothetical protein